MAKRDTGYTILRADGRVERLTRETPFTLEEIQAIVGGDIEIPYRSHNGFLFVCNERGNLKELPINYLASTYAAERGFDFLIVGDVLICPDWMIE